MQYSLFKYEINKFMFLQSISFINNQMITTIYAQEISWCLQLLSMNRQTGYIGNKFIDLSLDLLFYLNVKRGSVCKRKHSLSTRNYSVMYAQHCVYIVHLISFGHILILNSGNTEFMSIYKHCKTIIIHRPKIVFEYLDQLYYTFSLSICIPDI